MNSVEIYWVCSVQPFAPTSFIYLNWRWTRLFDFFHRMLNTLCPPGNNLGIFILHQDYKFISVVKHVTKLGYLIWIPCKKAWHSSANIFKHYRNWNTSKAWHAEFVYHSSSSSKVWELVINLIDALRCLGFWQSSHSHSFCKALFVLNIIISHKLWPCVTVYRLSFEGFSPWLWKVPAKYIVLGIREIM